MDIDELRIYGEALAPSEVPPPSDSTDVPVEDWAEVLDSVRRSDTPVGLAIYQLSSVNYVVQVGPYHKLHFINTTTWKEDFTITIPSPSVPGNWYCEFTEMRDAFGWASPNFTITTYPWEAVVLFRNSTLPAGWRVFAAITVYNYTWNGKYRVCGPYVDGVRITRNGTYTVREYISDANVTALGWTLDSCKARQEEILSQAMSPRLWRRYRTLRETLEWLLFGFVVFFRVNGVLYASSSDMTMYRYKFMPLVGLAQGAGLLNRTWLGDLQIKAFKDIPFHRCSDLETSLTRDIDVRDVNNTGTSYVGKRMFTDYLSVLAAVANDTSWVPYAQQLIDWLVENAVDAEGYYWYDTYDSVYQYADPPDRRLAYPAWLTLNALRMLREKFGELPNMTALEAACRKTIELCGEFEAPNWAYGVYWDAARGNSTAFRLRHVKDYYGLADFVYPNGTVMDEPGVYPHIWYAMWYGNATLDTCWQVLQAVVRLACDGTPLTSERVKLGETTPDPYRPRSYWACPILAFYLRWDRERDRPAEVVLWDEAHGRRCTARYVAEVEGKVYENGSVPLRGIYNVTVRRFYEVGGGRWVLFPASLLYVKAELWRLRVAVRDSSGRELSAEVTVSAEGWSERAETGSWAVFDFLPAGEYAVSALGKEEVVTVDQDTDYVLVINASAHEPSPKPSPKPSPAPTSPPSFTLAPSTWITVGLLAGMVVIILVRSSFKRKSRFTRQKL